MDRFTRDEILLASLVMVAITIAWYFIAAFKTKRFLEAGTADGFLRYRHADSHTNGMSAAVLHASLMGSAFSLASAVYVYINWAATEGAFALWSPIAWTLGACVLYFLRKQIFSESRGSWTLHTFLEQKYGSQELKRVASLITVAVFLLQVSAEVYVGLSVLNVFLGRHLPLWSLFAIVGGVFVAYSMIGGFPAIMITDEIKYRLIVFGLLVAGIYLLDNGGATAVRRVKESITSTFWPQSSQSWIMLLNIFALNLPIFITDMSVWQRVGGASDESEVTRGVGRFAFMLLPWMVGIIFVGIGFGKDLVPPEGWTNSQAILAFLSGTTVFPVLLAGLLAALLTTADSYLIAAVQTVVVDWVYSKSLGDVGFEPTRLGAGEQRRMLRVSRAGIFVLGMGSVLFGYFFLSTIPTLLDLLFVIFGMQTALAPTVLWGLLGKARSSDAAAGIVSVVVGGLTALICLFMAMGGALLAGVSIGLWSPGLVLVTAVIMFAVVRKLGVAQSPGAF